MMGSVIDCGDFSVEYIEDLEKSSDIEHTCKYTICRVNSEDVKQIRKLTDEGYMFHDRIVEFEIDIPSTEYIREAKTPKINMVDLVNGSEITQEMLNLAETVFSDDSRFNLSRYFDEREKGLLIREYLRREMINARLFTALYQNQLVGYTIVSAREKVVAENIFGLTKPGIVGKVAAFPLYSHMLKRLQENGIKKLIARVSTRNINSLNLHIELGGKIKDVRDEYIFRE